MPAPHKKTSGKSQRKQARTPHATGRRPAHEAKISPALEKEVWKPGTMLYPVPAVMITSIDKEGHPNICTVAWTGTVCSEPPMLSISLRKATHSYGLILQSREFVVNIPSVDQIRATDYCGVVSGRDVDKFAQARLTPGEAKTVRAPIIMECPINIECHVKKVLELGLHTMFVAEITSVQVSKRLIDRSGRFAIEKAGLAAYAHGGYYALKDKLGFFGFSVCKKKNVRR